jgi:hypothetical protein
VVLLPIRRFDAAKALFGLFNQVLFAAMVYPLLPDAIKYAMDALKRSVHNCYFCSKLQPAPLTDEVAYFEQRHGPSSALTRLLSLRAKYRSSFGFVLRCLPAVARLHLRTAFDNHFPRHVHANCRLGVLPAKPEFSTWPGIGTFYLALTPEPSYPSQAI